VAVPNRATGAGAPVQRIGLLATLLWVGLPVAASAQLPAAPGGISGLVKSAEGEPLAAVGITLRAAADSAQASGALTDRGRFREGRDVGRVHRHSDRRTPVCTGAGGGPQ
jgi:hypothetical protein